MAEFTNEKYTVFSKDGESFGPVDMVTLVAWAKDGRVNATSKLVSDLDGKVYRAEDFPDLKNIVSGLPPVIPTPTQQSAQNPIPLPQTQNDGSGHVINIINNVQSNNTGQNPQYVTQIHVPKSKIVAGLLAFFLGWLGIHRFYLGYGGLGVLMLLLSVLSCGWLIIPVYVWAIIEGILILTGGIRDSQGMPLKD